MKSPSKWWVLLTVVSGTFVGALNTGIVNVSVPSLMRAFHAKLHEVEWVITAFMIAFSVTMPLTNWLKERLSYRMLFILSLVVFIVGSILCGVSTSLPMLIFSRIVQAIGGGAMGPLSMAIVADTFPANERGRAFGIWGFGVVIGPAIGPTLGGYLSETLSWRWIFYINVPLGLVAIALGWKFLHRAKLEVTHRIPFDTGGFVWITSAIVALLYSMALMADSGLTLWSATLLLVSALCTFFFLQVEKRMDYPLWDLALFRNQLFVSCVLVTLVRSIALFGGIFLLPFILQDHMHLSESRSGLVMLPGSLVIALMMPLSGILADRGYTRLLTTTGLLFVALSFFSFVGVNPYTPEWFAVSILVLRGIGLGLLVTPLASATMNAVKPPQVAMASSISNLAQQLGGSLGIALLVLLKSFFFKIASLGGQTSDQAELYSLHSCFLIGGLIVLVSLIPARKIH